MFKAGDVVYPTIDSNERYVVSNHRNKCIFEIKVVGSSYSLVLCTSSILEILGTEYTIDNDYLTKENTYKINTMAISVGTKVKHKHYPGTIFEVMDADSGESLIFYLEGAFSAEVADEFWVNTHDLTSLSTPVNYSVPSDRGYKAVGVPAKQVPNKVVVVDDYYDEVEAQVRELEKQHKSKPKQEDKVFVKPQPMTEYKAAQIVDSLRDDTGDLVDKYLDELGVRTHSKKPIGKYNQRNLRLLNGILD